MVFSEGFLVAAITEPSSLKAVRGFAYLEYFAVKTPKSLQFKPLCHFCLKSEDFTKILSKIC